mgnify:CR=1 FL=1
MTKWRYVTDAEDDFFIARDTALLIMFVLFIVWSNSPFNTLPIFVLD